jgi:hypothetical protein
LDESREEPMTTLLVKELDDLEKSALNDFAEDDLVEEIGDTVPISESAQATTDVNEIEVEKAELLITEDADQNFGNEPLNLHKESVNTLNVEKDLDWVDVKLGKEGPAIEKGCVLERISKAYDSQADKSTNPFRIMVAESKLESESTKIPEVEILNDNGENLVKTSLKEEKVPHIIEHLSTTSDVYDFSQQIDDIENESLKSNLNDREASAADIGLNRKMGAEGLHSEYSKELHYGNEGRDQNVF